MKKILVLNSGSSSLKYQLFAVDGDKYEVIAKGLADRIGIDNSFVTIKIRDGEKITKNVDIPSHQEAIREVFALLLNGALGSMSELSGVGHRVVQGGSIFKESTLVTDKVIEQIDELSSLAPLHNPAAVLGLKAMKALLPDVKQVVVFDTAFHQSMKPEAFLYALPLEQYKNIKSAVMALTAHRISMSRAKLPNSLAKKARLLFAIWVTVRQFPPLITASALIPLWALRRLPDW